MNQKNFSRDHSSIKNYLSNFSWLFVIRIFRIVLSLFITIWVARYLGPENFGLFNYALSFVMLFSIFSSLGIEHVFTKDIINNPNNENRLMGSSFVLKLIGAIFLMLLSIGLIRYLKPNDTLILEMVCIFSFGFLFKSLEIIRFWFEAHVQAKYSTIVDALALMVSVLFKVILIVFNASVEVFAWVIFFESLFLSIGLVFIYMKSGNSIFSWQPSLTTMKNILIEAWPLMLAGALYTIYTRVDQLMLGDMINNEAVGVYVAAVNISQGWLFLPTIIGTAFYPAILNARNKDKKTYITLLQDLLNILSLLGILVATIIIFVAKPFILLAYGKSYLESSSILIVHIWGGVFIAMSAISYRYFIAEGLQKTSFYRGLIGLIVNIGMNMILIPIYGALGAAIATVISLIMSLYLFNVTNTKTREMFIMQTKALFMINTLQTLLDIKSLKKNV